MYTRGRPLVKARGFWRTLRSGGLYAKGLHEDRTCRDRAFGNADDRSACRGRCPVTRAIVVMGVSGAGKTTVGRALARRIGGTFVEGDDLHPASNREKMAAGIPLIDADRLPWLGAVAAAIRLHEGDALVISCSALRRRYRDIIRTGAARPVLFVWLKGTKDRIRALLAERKGHFMPVSLLESQFDALEPPDPDEPHLAVEIGAPVGVVVTKIVAGLRARPD